MSTSPIIVKRRIKGAALSVVGLVTALLFLFPYVTMFSTALKPKGDITDIPPTYLPQHYIWSNFIKVFSAINFGTYIKNTIIIALATMIIGLIASIPAGYYVARHNFRGRTLFLLVVLITQMFSPTTLLIEIGRAHV